MPHAPLSAYYAHEIEHHRFLTRIFDDTAVDYDRVERILAFGSGPWYRRQALMRGGLMPGMEVLDVGIGTGLLARQAVSIVGPGGRVTGVDPSVGMMEQVRLADVSLLAGLAESLPVRDASFDFVCMGYALRHVANVDAALAEFHRVLRPGGRMLMLEITRPTGPVGRAALKGYMRMLVPVIARVVAKSADTARLWRYYWDTIDACISPALVVDALSRTGFVEVERGLQLGIFSEYRAVKAPNPKLE